MTDVNEFIKFLKIIGRDNWNKLFIIPLRKKSKRPLVKKGESWLNKRIDIKTAIELLKKGYNIGLVAKPDGFLFIDVDDKVDLELPETLIVSTNIGYHYYFFNKGVTKNHINSKFEIRANNYYVVGAGSRVEKVYRIVNPVYPAEFTGDMYEKLIHKGRCIQTY